MIPAGFKGSAVALSFSDLAIMGRRMGVGEDEIRAVLEVKAVGGGFDKLGRPHMLFEPHVFLHKLSPGQKPTAAEAQWPAYPKWA